MNSKIQILPNIFGGIPTTVNMPPFIFGCDPAGDSDGKEAETGSNDDGNNTGANSGHSSGANKTSANNDSDNSGDDSEDDEEEDLSGLTTRELRRLYKDAIKNKKITNSELEELRTKVEAQERAESSDLENAQRDIDKLTKERDKFKKIVGDNAVIMGILTYTKFTFHDPRIVANLVNAEEISIDYETGKVDGLEAELARIAKDKDFLVKSAAKERDSKRNETGSSGSTGSKPGQGVSTKVNVNQEKADLVARYPALAGR